MLRRESGRATEVAVAVAGYIVNQTRGLATAGLEGSEGLECDWRIC